MQQDDKQNIRTNLSVHTFMMSVCVMRVDIKCSSDDTEEEEKEEVK